jgi:hypothetical protein
MFPEAWNMMHTRSRMEMRLAAATQFSFEITKDIDSYSLNTSVQCMLQFVGNQLSGKIPENIAKLLFYQKTHGARRRDGEGPRGAHTTWWRGPGQAALGGGVAALVSSSTSPSSYK